MELGQDSAQGQALAFCSHHNGSFVGPAASGPRCAGLGLLEPQGMPWPEAAMLNENPGSPPLVSSWLYSRSSRSSRS